MKTLSKIALTTLSLLLISTSAMALGDGVSNSIIVPEISLIRDSKSGDLEETADFVIYLQTIKSLRDSGIITSGFIYKIENLLGGATIDLLGSDQTIGKRPLSVNLSMDYEITGPSEHNEGHNALKIKGIEVHFLIGDGGLTSANVRGAYCRATNGSISCEVTQK